MADPFIGFELEDLYRIDELIGAGGWGNVYRGTHLTDGTILAIKIVHKHHLQNELSLKRFEQEAKLLSRIDSKYIVRILDHGFSPAPFIVMEYFDGMPLSKWLKENGPMNSAMAIDLFLQLCDGLSAAESIRIVHRDLKPANILLTNNGSRIQAKILDFGLAKSSDQSTGADKLTATGDVLGSPPYMSPEQWKGQCDNRSDIYAMGCIMYEVLAGRPAFTAQYGMDYLNKHLNEKPAPISDVNMREKFPDSLLDIVTKCLQKSPANRYQTSAACSADLKKVKIGRKPIIIIAEDKKTQKFAGFIVGVTLLAAVLAALYLSREPIVRSLSSQLYAQADSKLAMGQSDDAIGQYRQILFLSQALPAKDMQKLRALRGLASLLRDRKELTAAESLERQVGFLIGDANRNPELMLQLARIRNAIASGKLIEADKQANGALEQTAASLGKDSLAYSTFLDLLGTIACKKGSFDEAINYEKQSLALAENLLDQNDLRKAEIMEHLAEAMKAAGNTEESEKYFALALSVKNSAKNSRKPDTENEKTPLTAVVKPNSSPEQVRINPATTPAVQEPVNAAVLKASKPPVTAVKPRVETVERKPRIEKVERKPRVEAVERKPRVETAERKPRSNSGWSQLEQLRSVK